MRVIRGQNFDDGFIVGGWGSENNDGVIFRGFVNEVGVGEGRSGVGKWDEHEKNGEEFNTWN